MTDQNTDLIAGKTEERQLLRLGQLGPIRLTQPLLNVMVAMMGTAITAYCPHAWCASGGFG
jgi:hypothetical protein